jgi:hypothetical protein
MKQILVMMAVMAVVACSSTSQQPGERPDPPAKDERKDELPSWLQIFGPLIEVWLNSGVSDEQKLHLGDSIKQQLEHGPPEEGWVDWFERWSRDNVG